MMKVDDRIIAPSRGTESEAIDYARTHNATWLDDCEDYIATVYDLCDPDDMPDASIVIAQSVHETSDPGPWQSYWWVERLNPAGMGITGDPGQNEQSHTFKTGQEAARGQVSHLLLYATGRIDRGGLTPDDDPRFDAYIDAYGHTAQATTIDGLTGKWGTDPQYAGKVCDRGNAVYDDLPDQGASNMPDVVFGKVPHPVFEDRDAVPPNTAWDDLGPRTIRAICWHRMLGTLMGTDSWFRGGGASTALTDYGIGCTSIDGAAADGRLLRWNDPRGRCSPWANGRLSEPYGDGLAFYELYGTEGINRDIVSVENSGYETTPVSAGMAETLAQLTAYWADQYHVSWETFPLIPDEGGRSFVIWHQEFTIGTGKECPFAELMAETSAIIDRAGEILKQYQLKDEEPAPDYPKKRIPVEVESQGFALTLNSPNRFACIQGTTMRTYPNREAPAGTETPAKAGKNYTFDFSTDVEGETWLVSKAGSWALATAFEAA